MTQNVPTAVMNSAILDELTRENSNSVEKTAQASSEYIRLGLREDSFAMKILPPEQATDDMLDRGMQEGLSITVELEPDGPGAKFVPFQTVPDAEYIESSNFRIPFARLLTPKFQKDIDELRTTRMDIRKILTDNALKDAHTEYDRKFIELVNSIVNDCDGPGEPNHQTGKVQLMEFEGGLNRRTFAQARNMLPRGNAQGKYRLRNDLCLMNEITAGELLTFGRDEVGGDLSQTFFTDGLTIDKFLGVKCVFTIKDDLVPDGWVYFFAAPKFLGRAYYLTDWTMYMKKEAYFIEMFSYWLGGVGIGNVAGVALAKFGVQKQQS